MKEEANVTTKNYLKAACSAILSSLILIPLDVIYSRVALGPHCDFVSRDKLAYKNTISAFRYIIKHEGIRGFYRGYLPGVLMKLA